MKKRKNRDFPGSPVVKTLPFHCRGHPSSAVGTGSVPGQGNYDPTCHMAKKKKKKKVRIIRFE